MGTWSERSEEVLAFLRHLSADEQRRFLEHRTDQVHADRRLAMKLGFAQAVLAIATAAYLATGNHAAAACVVGASAFPIIALVLVRSWDVPLLRVAGGARDEDDAESGVRPPAAERSQTGKPIWEIAAEVIEGVPEELWDYVPEDASLECKSVG